MITIFQSILARIAAADTRDELLRLRDEIIPSALLTNAQQHLCLKIINEALAPVPCPASGLTGEIKPEPEAVKIPAPHSPGGASFFIRHDGQYFCAQLFENEDGIIIRGKHFATLSYRVIRSAVLGFQPDGTGVLHQFDDFFLN